MALRQWRNTTPSSYEADALAVDIVIIVFLYLGADYAEEVSGLYDVDDALWAVAFCRSRSR